MVVFFYTPPCHQRAIVVLEKRVLDFCRKKDVRLKEEKIWDILGTGDFGVQFGVNF